MKVLTIGGATQDIFIVYEKMEVAQLDRDGVSMGYLLFEQGRKIEIDGIEYHVRLAHAGPFKHLFGHLITVKNSQNQLICSFLK